MTILNWFFKLGLQFDAFLPSTRHCIQWFILYSKIRFPWTQRHMWTKEQSIMLSISIGKTNHEYNTVIQHNTVSCLYHIELCHVNRQLKKIKITHLTMIIVT